MDCSISRRTAKCNGSFIIERLINFNELINIAFQILMCPFAANSFLCYALPGLCSCYLTVKSTFCYEGTPEFRLR